MQFFKKIRDVYHPATLHSLDRSKWYICNVLIGARPLKQNKGRLVTDLDAYRNDNQISIVRNDLIDDKQDAYIEDLVKWVETKNVQKAYFDGGYSKNEIAALRKVGIAAATKHSGTYLKWTHDYLSTLLSISIQNFYLETLDGTLLCAYDTWDTIYIYDINNSLPPALMQPRM